MYPSPTDLTFYRIYDKNKDEYPVAYYSDNRFKTKELAEDYIMVWRRTENSVDFGVEKVYIITEKV